MSSLRNTLGQPVGAPVPDWTARSLPPQAAMVGRTCRIEILDPDRHGAGLHAAFRTDIEGRLWTYLPQGPFDDERGFRFWLEEFCLGADPMFHTIIDLATGNPVGMASYLRITPSVGVIEVGHINFAPSLQRTIAATEAMYLMMARVFDELGYRRYEWKCDALNRPSRRAAERLGFCFEGIFRQATLYKGRNRDTAWYAMIDTDWPARRIAFEAWLSPDNFTADGSQIRTLSQLARSVSG